MCIPLRYTVVDTFWCNNWNQTIDHLNQMYFKQTLKYLLSKGTVYDPSSIYWLNSPVGRESQVSMSCWRLDWDRTDTWRVDKSNNPSWIRDQQLWVTRAVHDEISGIVRLRQRLTFFKTLVRGQKEVENGKLKVYPYKVQYTMQWCIWHFERVI